MRQYFSAIKHSFSKGEMEIEAQLSFLERIINFCVLDDLSFLSTEEQIEDAEFVYRLFKSALQGLK